PSSLTDTPIEMDVAFLNSMNERDLSILQPVLDNDVDIQIMEGDSVSKVTLIDLINYMSGSAVQFSKSTKQSLPERVFEHIDEDDEVFISNDEQLVLIISTSENLIRRIL